MVDWRKISRRRWAAFMVLALALADAIAIYYAHNRLSTPWTEQAGNQAAGETLIAEAETPHVIVKDVWPAAPALAVKVVPESAPIATLAPPAPVPEYRPIKLAVEDEAPVPELRLAARVPERSTSRVARLQKSKRAVRRFETAFPAGIAAPVAQETIALRAEPGAPPVQSGDLTQPGAASGYSEIYAQLARDNGSAGGAAAEAPAQDSAGPVAPQAEPGFEAELPAVDADSASEVPSG